jgi:hypothetical protein
MLKDNNYKPSSWITVGQKLHVPIVQGEQVLRTQILQLDVFAKLLGSKHLKLHFEMMWFIHIPRDLLLARIRPNGNIEKDHLRFKIIHQEAPITRAVKHVMLVNDATHLEFFRFIVKDSTLV